jgi:hypothetical protein
MSPHLAKKGRMDFNLTRLRLLKRVNRLAGIVYNSIVHRREATG